MGDGGGNGNGIPSPDDSPHTDKDLPTGGPDSVDSPSTDQEGGDPGAGTDGTKPEDEGKSKVDRRDNDADADKDTEALREAVKLGLQQWVDSLTSRQDFNDATEAFRSAGIDIPVPSRTTRDSRSNGYTSTPESQPTALIGEPSGVNEEGANDTHDEDDGYPSSDGTGEWAKPGSWPTACSAWAHPEAVRAQRDEAGWRTCVRT